MITFADNAHFKLFIAFSSCQVFFIKCRKFGDSESGTKKSFKNCAIAYAR